MAEASAVALGRYLRELRERRGLSLARACEITQSSSEALDKGTLSRLERGQQTPSIFRLAPLTRIYEISADALIERMELDREVDRIGGPDTDGKPYHELHADGAAAMGRTNRKWDAYACFRDAVPVAPPDKRFTAWINLITAVRTLGKNALALHELREMQSMPGLEPGQQALIHERMAACCRCLGDSAQAERHAESAITQARACDDTRILAYAYTTRAGVAVDLEQWEPASGYLLKSLATYRDGQERSSRLLPSPSFEAQAVLMLAECSLKLRSFARARRLTQAAQRVSREHGVPAGLAYSELIFGWLDEANGEVERAVQRWRKAAAMAARIENPRIVFAAEVEIYRLALMASGKARAQASRRRLERLAPWVPRHIPAFRLYRQLIEHDGASRAGKGGEHEDPTSAPRAAVSDVQHDGAGSRAAHGRAPARSRRPRVVPGPG